VSLDDVFPTFRKIVFTSLFKGPAECFVSSLALEDDSFTAWHVCVAQDREKVTGFCEHGNEPLHFRKFRGISRLGEEMLAFETSILLLGVRKLHLDEIQPAVFGTHLCSTNNCSSTLYNQQPKDRLQGLRVRIPPGAWLSVSCECCVLSGRGLCDGLLSRPEESYHVGCV